MTKEEALSYNLDVVALRKNQPNLYERVLLAMEQYANQKAIEIAGEAWNAAWHEGNFCKQTFLSNLKKKLEA